MAHIRLESPKGSPSMTNDLFKLIEGSATPLCSGEKKGLFASFWKKPNMIRREFEHQALAGPSYSVESELTESETNVGDADDAWNVESRDDEVWGFDETVQTPREDYSRSITRDNGFPPLPPGSASRSGLGKMKAKGLAKGKHLNPKVLLSRTTKKKQSNRKPKDFSLIQMISQSFDSEAGSEIPANRIMEESIDAIDMFSVGDQTLSAHQPATAYAQLDLTGEITKVIPQHNVCQEFLSPAPTISEDEEQAAEESEGGALARSTSIDDDSADGNDVINSVIPSFKDRLAFYKAKSKGHVDTSSPKQTSDPLLKQNESIVSDSITTHDTGQENPVSSMSTRTEEKEEDGMLDEEEEIVPCQVDEVSCIPVLDRIKKIQLNLETGRSTHCGRSKIVAQEEAGLDEIDKSKIENNPTTVRGRNTSGKAISILVPPYPSDITSTDCRSTSSKGRLSDSSHHSQEVKQNQFNLGGNMRPSHIRLAGRNSPTTPTIIAESEITEYTPTLAERKAAFLSNSIRRSDSSGNSPRHSLESQVVEGQKAIKQEAAMERTSENRITEMARKPDKRQDALCLPPKVDTVQLSKSMSNQAQKRYPSEKSGNLTTLGVQGRVTALRSSIENSHDPGNLKMISSSSLEHDPTNISIAASDMRSEGVLEGRLQRIDGAKVNGTDLIVTTRALPLSIRRKTFTTQIDKDRYSTMSSGPYDLYKKNSKSGQRTMESSVSKQNSLGTVACAVHDESVVNAAGEPLVRANDVSQSQLNIRRPTGYKPKSFALSPQSSKKIAVGSSNLSVPRKESLERVGYGVRPLSSEHHSGVGSSESIFDSGVQSSIADRKKALMLNFQDSSKVGSGLLVETGDQCISISGPKTGRRMNDTTIQTNLLPTARNRTEVLGVGKDNIMVPAAQPSQTNKAFATVGQTMSMAERKRAFTLNAHNTPLAESKAPDPLQLTSTSVDLMSGINDGSQVGPINDGANGVNETSDELMSIADRMRYLRSSFRSPIDIIKSSSDQVPSALSSSVVGIVANGQSKNKGLDTSNKSKQVDEIPPLIIEDLEPCTTPGAELGVESKGQLKSIADRTRAFELNISSMANKSFPNPAPIDEEKHNSLRCAPRKIDKESPGPVVVGPEKTKKVSSRCHASGDMEGPRAEKVEDTFVSRLQFVKSKSNFTVESGLVDIGADERQISDEPSSTSTRAETPQGVFANGEHPLYVVVDGSCSASECLSPSPRMLERKVVEPGSGMSYFEQLHAHANGSSPTSERQQAESFTPETCSNSMPSWYEKAVSENEDTGTVERYHAVKCRFSQKALPWRQKNAAERYLERKRHTFSHVMETPENQSDVCRSYPITQQKRTSDLFCPILNESLIVNKDSVKSEHSTPARGGPSSFRSPFGTPVNGYVYGNIMTPK